MPKSSIEIRNEVKALDDQIAQAEAAFNSAESDEARARARDSISEYKGQQKALNDILDDVLEDERKIREGGGVPLASAQQPAAFSPKTFADRLLGDPRDFKPLKKGDRLSASFGNTAPDYGLPRIETLDPTLPSQLSTALPSFGFLDSLAKGTTNGDIKYFVAKGVTNAAATWEAGNLKPTSTMEWEQETAQVETIAHGMPVLEENLADYGQLQSMINTELLAGLRLVEAAKALNGDNSRSGIVGVLKNENIVKYTAKSGDDLADSIRRMKTDSWLGSRFMPTHIAMHPLVVEQLELEKDANGRYLNVMVNGRLWALPVVEDMNLVSGGVGSEKYGVLVYWNGAATWYTRATDSLAVGVVDDQFMRNELTIRAEGRHALKVTYPKSFVYLADSGVKAR